MDVEKLIDQARDELAGAREQIELAVTRALQMIGRVEEENRRLRREALNHSLKVFTEVEAAQELRISATTLRTLRAEKRLPHFRAGDRVLYTQEHLVRITQLLERPVVLREAKRSAS